MATQNWGSHYPDVLAGVQWDHSCLCVDSVPVSTVDVDTWIEEACAAIANVAQNVGMDVSALLEAGNEDVFANMRAGIRLYVRARASEAMGGIEGINGQLRERWDAWIADLRSRQRAAFGSAQPANELTRADGLGAAPDYLK